MRRDAHGLRAQGRPTSAPLRPLRQRCTQAQVKVIVGIQARMGSTRLPGKVMADLRGKPMIRRVWNACAGPWRRMVLTTNKEEDDALCAYLKDQGMDYRRGSEP